MLRAAGTVADNLRAVQEQIVQAALRAGRERLSPETVATVERSLATIDRAIREAREALARARANAALVDVLAANYEHKVELLRRATELSTRI